MVKAFNTDSRLTILKYFIDNNDWFHFYFCIYLRLALFFQKAVEALVTRDSFYAEEIDIFKAISKWKEANPELPYSGNYSQKMKCDKNVN